MSALHRFKPNLPTWLALSFLASAASSHPQGMALIVVERPFHSRHIAGVVLDASAEPVNGVLVEMCRAQNQEPGYLACRKDPASVQASATTDEQGHFEFKERGRTVYLHLSSKGFDPMEVRIDRRIFARSEVRIRLYVAT